MSLMTSTLMNYLFQCQLPNGRAPHNELCTVVTSEQDKVKQKGTKSFKYHQMINIFKLLITIKFHKRMTQVLKMIFKTHITMQ